MDTQTTQGGKSLQISGASVRSPGLRRLAGHEVRDCDDEGEFLCTVIHGSGESQASAFAIGSRHSLAVEIVAAPVDLGLERAVNAGSQETVTIAPPRRHRGRGQEGRRWCRLRLAPAAGDRHRYGCESGQDEYFAKLVQCFSLGLVRERSIITEVI